MKTNKCIITLSTIKETLRRQTDVATITGHLLEVGWSGKVTFKVVPERYDRTQNLQRSYALGNKEKGRRFPEVRLGRWARAILLRVLQMVVKC